MEEEKIPQDYSDKKLHINYRALGMILNALGLLELKWVVNFGTAKEAWNKLQKVVDNGCAILLKRKK